MARNTVMMAVASSRALFRFMAVCSLTSGRQTLTTEKILRRRRPRGTDLSARHTRAGCTGAVPAAPAAAKKGGECWCKLSAPITPRSWRPAGRYDFETFAAGELPARQKYEYPPFGSMIRLVVRGPVEPIAGEFAEQIATRLRGAGKSRHRRGARGPGLCRLPSCGGTFASRFSFRALTARPCDRRCATPPLRENRPIWCSGSPTSIRWTCSKSLSENCRGLSPSPRQYSDRL